MIFKCSERMQDEWWKLEPRLWQIIVDVEIWCRERGICPVWTCFLRTEAEQDALVSSGASKYPNSVHEYGRGADLREFEPEARRIELQTFINSKYAYGDGLHQTMIWHEGTALHGHIQVRQL